MILDRSGQRSCFLEKIVKKAVCCFSTCMMIEQIAHYRIMSFCDILMNKLTNKETTRGLQIKKKQKTNSTSVESILSELVKLKFNLGIF